MCSIHPIPCDPCLRWQTDTHPPCAISPDSTNTEGDQPASFPHKEPACPIIGEDPEDTPASSNITTTPALHGVPIGWNKVSLQPTQQTNEWKQSGLALADEQRPRVIASNRVTVVVEVPQSRNEHKQLIQAHISNQKDTIHSSGVCLLIDWLNRILYSCKSVLHNIIAHVNNFRVTRAMHSFIPASCTRLTPNSNIHLSSNFYTSRSAIPHLFTWGKETEQKYQT